MNQRSARVIQVVEVVTLEGEGTTESVCREVTSYYALDGELLAVNDPVNLTAPLRADPVHERAFNSAFVPRNTIKKST